MPTTRKPAKPATIGSYFRRRHGKCDRFAFWPAKTVAQDEDWLDGGAEAQLAFSRFIKACVTHGGRFHPNGFQSIWKRTSGF
jgi:hypothetical protein